MAKALLFVHSEKVPVRSQKYPHLNLSRSTTIFPTFAREHLVRLGKGKVMKADIEDKELDSANERWLAGKVLLVPIAGELFHTKFSLELETLLKWAKKGVCEGELGEYTRRLNLLRKETESLKDKLFDTGATGVIIREVTHLAQPNSSNEKFEDSRLNLKKVSSKEQEIFKSKVAEILIRPMDVIELARELRTNGPNLRKRLRLLMRGGLVKSTTQRLVIGRPKVVYFLAHDI